MHQVFQDSILGWRELDRLAISFYGLLQGIQFYAGDLKNGSRSSFTATDQRFHACDEFPQVKGLAEIIIGSLVQQFHDRLSTLTSRKYEYGSRIPFGAETLEKGEAALPGKHKIEDDQVIAALLRELFSVNAVLSVVHGEAVALSQCAGKIFGQPYFILDDKYTHL